MITDLTDTTLADQDRQWLNARFRQLANKYSRQVLDTLFFQCYQAIPSLSRFLQLRSFLISQALFIYPGIFTYTEHLQTLPGDDTCSQRSLIVREARYLCREIVLRAFSDASIPFAERRRLHQALQWLKVVPEELNGVHINQQEVMANIDHYLDKSDLLAELPQFQAARFTGDELIAFYGLQFYDATPELELQLDRVLHPLRKRNILQAIRHFIITYPLPFAAKQALAAYISLGEVIPWHKHSFIKRLLAVSYQEAKVYAMLAQ